MSHTVYAPHSAWNMPNQMRNVAFPVRMRLPAESGSSSVTPSGMSSQGSTKNGAIIHAAFFTPKTIGSVRQAPARSPSMSEKSFVDAAPSRKSMKTMPMNHGSLDARYGAFAENAYATIVHPAT